MLYMYLAAVFLIPASFQVFSSRQEWIGAARGGIRAFFHLVAERAPSVVRKTPSRLHSLFVYYPMLVGLELLRSKNIKSTLRKMYATVEHRLGIAGPPQGVPLPVMFRRRPAEHLPLEDMERLIRQPETQVVSFDIFDTLLMRPALRPKDVFYLAAATVKKEHNLDFIALRLGAEERLGKPNATIHEIYAHMAKTHGLSAETAAAIMAEELRCEERLLTPRPDMVRLYAEAVRHGKRVIAVSDMYLTGDILAGILRRKGFEDIAAVYVSCDHGARKSNGALYDFVLAAEGVAPASMVHIGDNAVSDHAMALGRNIVALHYPSVVEMAFGTGDLMGVFLGDVRRIDPFWSVLLGFSINQMYGEAAKAPANLANLTDMAHFSHLVLGPLLTGISLGFANDESIQATYKQLYFASRDGYLPQKIYSHVASCIGGIPGVYFQAGRRAYYPFLIGSFTDYVATRPMTGDVGTYTLHDFLAAHFHGDPVLAMLEDALTEAEMGLIFYQNKQQCLEVLRPYTEAVEEALHSKRMRAKQYYDTVFDPAEERLLIFDVGYSGSVGTAVTAITGKPADKIYFWELKGNRLADKAAGTTTRILMGATPLLPCHLILEELFGPCCGGAVDFDEEGRPVFEDVPFTPEHRAAMDMVHETCQDFAASFCALLGDYARGFALREPEAPLKLCETLMVHAPFCNLRIFENIVFPDPLHYTRTPSLEQKVERLVHWPSPFSGTGFEHIGSALRPQPACEPGHGPVGVHLHLYHRGQIGSMIRYLREFPVDFDLFITITESSFAQTADRLFCHELLPRMGRCAVIPVPNRGRDVAPWIVGTAPFQEKYELFCHAHTKESAYHDFGQEWRDFLLDNTLGAAFVAQTVTAFAQDPALGCLMPELFGKLYRCMHDGHISPGGIDNERVLINDLLHRLGLSPRFARSDLFFSAGTMFWYRPKALRQLFQAGLTVSDFEPEPIGVGGSLAHAIERLPAVIACQNGYTAKTFRVRQDWDTDAPRTGT